MAVGGACGGRFGGGGVVFFWGGKAQVVAYRMTYEGHAPYMPSLVRALLRAHAAVIRSSPSAACAAHLVPRLVPKPLITAVTALKL